MIEVVKIAQIALLGAQLDVEIKQKVKERDTIKAFFRQRYGAGDIVYANGAWVQIGNKTIREKLQRKPIEDAIGIKRLVEIGALIKVDVEAPVRLLMR